MEITRSAIGVLAAACVSAGAVGAYLMTPVAAPVPVADLTASEPDDAPIRLVGEERTPRTPARVSARVTPVPTRVVHPDPAPDLSVPPASNPVLVERPAVPDSEPAEEIASATPLPSETPRSNNAALPQPSAPPLPELEELVVSADSVIGLQIETAVTSETARVEDVVSARVSRDVRVGNRIAIPAGSRARGEVTLVERGGKVRERARLGVRFTSIVLTDGTTLPIESEAIVREGDSPGRESTTKIGVGAIAGSVIGGLLGGGKGAAIGGAVGGGAGSAVVLAGGRNPATLVPGSPVTIRLREPATVTVER
jgi:hypothetical protein